MKASKPWPEPTPEIVDSYMKSREREKSIQPGATVRFTNIPALRQRVRLGMVGAVVSVEDSFAKVRVRFLRYFHREIFTHVSNLEPSKGG